MVANSTSLDRSAPSRLNSLHSAGISKVAPAQPGSDPGCQWLGSERQSKNKCALRRVVDQSGRAAARFAARSGRSIRRKEKPVAKDYYADCLVGCRLPGPE